MNMVMMNAIREITQWVKYDGFSKAELGKILYAINKACLEYHKMTINELINERERNDR